MTTHSKIVAAALGFLVLGGAVADASAATVVTKTRTVAATHAIKPVVARKSVTIVHRAHRVHRPHLARILPGHRFLPRLKVARAVSTKHIVKTTIVR